MYKVKVRTVTLAFDLATWFLLTTHRLVIMIISGKYRLVTMIICVKLFSNPTMHNKVMGRTQTGFTEVHAQSFSADRDLDL